MCESQFCQLHNSAGTSCTRNPEQIEIMLLEGYSRQTCNKLCASSHDALDFRRCNPQARPSTSFVDHTIDLPWRSFLSPELEAKFQTEVPLFLEVPNFLITQFRIDPPKLPRKKQLYTTSRFDTKPACDGQTDGRTDRHTTTAYTAQAYRVAR